MIVRALLVAAALTALLAVPAGAQAPAVLVAEVNGPITPVIAEHLRDAIAAAESGGYVALVVEIDTPGGLDTSMRAIVREFLGAEVPVIVYVAPSGARAASAGAIMTFAAHVAAMAPGTNIGAATPVSVEGADLDDKIVNDAIAYVTALAEARDRDVDFAVATVADGVSASAGEALERGGVDLVAPNLASLLNEVDGRTVALPGDRNVTLDTTGADTVDFDMSWVRELLQRIADPNLAFLFISIGTLAIIYEVATPGGMLAGVVGAILLVLAFFALSVLPVTLAGLLLLALAVGLFVAELFVPGVGAFAGGGTITLIIAGLLLFQRPTGIGIDLAVLLPVPLLVGAGVIVAGRFAWRARKAPPTLGAAGTMVGAPGTVREVGQRTQVFVEGALWRARTAGPPLTVGEPVRVVAMDGLELVVEPNP